MIQGIPMLGLLWLGSLTVVAQSGDESRTCQLAETAEDILNAIDASVGFANLCLPPTTPRYDSFCACTIAIAMADGLMLLQPDKCV